MENKLRKCCNKLPVKHSFWKKIADGMDAKFWHYSCPVCTITTDIKKSQVEAQKAWNNEETW